MLFDSVADSAGVLVDNLRVSYNSVRLFASVTADALEMPPEAELGVFSFEICLSACC